jgi:hypothetical protein
MPSKKKEIVQTEVTQPSTDIQLPTAPEIKVKNTRNKKTSEKNNDEPVLEGGAVKKKQYNKKSDKIINDKTDDKTDVKKSKKSIKKNNNNTNEEHSDDELNSGDSKKNLRSFKVKLPNSETFTGRFTGLTPYQAANKALSKYFRQNKNYDEDIEFSINETTRASKKITYNYIGKRFKLETPVIYEIKDNKDGSIKQIVKNYKNILKKVKKQSN